MKYFILTLIILSIKISAAEHCYKVIDYKVEFTKVYDLLQLKKNDEHYVVLLDRFKLKQSNSKEYFKIDSCYNMLLIFKDNIKFWESNNEDGNSLSGYSYITTNTLDSLDITNIGYRSDLTNLDKNEIVLFDIYDYNIAYPLHKSVKVAKVETYAGRDTTLEEQIYNLIRNLDKVQALEKSSEYPVVLIKKEETNRESMIIRIQVAVDSLLRLEPVYNFEYQIETKCLSYYDPVEDKLISASDWDKKHYSPESKEKIK